MERVAPDAEIVENMGAGAEIGGLSVAEDFGQDPRVANIPEIDFFVRFVLPQVDIGIRNLSRPRVCRTANIKHAKPRIEPTLLPG